MEIGLMQNQKVDVSVVPSAYGTAKGKRVVDPTVRLLVTNPLVKVEGSSIVGKGVGTTYIYALAHNGNVKRIRVAVVDYARPTTWENLDRAGTEVADLLLNKGEELGNVISYFTSRLTNDEELWYEMGEQNELTGTLTDVPNGIKGALESILSFSKLRTMVSAVKDGTLIVLRETTAVGAITYDVFFLVQDPSEAMYSDIVKTSMKIAEHWYVRKDVMAG
jgi:hypothetical protein